MDLEHQCIIYSTLFTSNIGMKYSHFILGAGGGHVHLQLLLGHGINTAEVPGTQGIKLAWKYLVFQLT